MSESEKKKRTQYRANRKRWILVQSLVLVIVSLAILICAIVSHQLNKTYYIGYTENGSIDYDVYLKENEFYDTPYLEKDQSYVASLIDKIITNFNYEIDMDTDNVNYRYSYSINSRLEIIDDTSGVAIYNPKYELVNVENKVQNSTDRLSINEIVVLNYDEYNNLANRFLAAYSLTKTTSHIVVTLTVDVLSDCTAFSGTSVDTYSSELRIPLTTQTVNIKMTSSVPAGESKMMACTRGVGSEVFKTTAIVLAVVDGLLALLLAAFVFFTRTEDITYTAQVNRVLSQYKSYIQRINNLFETRGYQVVMVNAFDEMLEIRDTIQAPILMYENADKTCSRFMIPTDSKLLYVYEIKIDGYVEPQVEDEKTSEPVTIVKPNITNVVRPVVKVVVSPLPPKTPTEPEATIETIVQEAEVEVAAEDTPPEVTVTVEEEAPESETEDVAVMADAEETVEEAAEETVDESVSVDDEIEALLASIPCTDEEGTVEAIDIQWEETEHKTYRYDPDGNKVEVGDVVLVPTRDEASDKDVVREAEVTRGNYMAPESEVERPLKKIIGVVRRRVEKLFTTMIAPDEEKKED